MRDSDCLRQQLIRTKSFKLECGTYLLTFSKLLSSKNKRPDSASFTCFSSDEHHFFLASLFYNLFKFPNMAGS